MKTVLLDKNFALSGTKLDILVYPNPILKKVSSPVEEFNEDLTVLVQNMLTTMYQAPGIGLAAPQIGINKRIFVIDTEFTREVEEQDNGEESITLDNIKPLVFINPVLKEKKGKTTYKEGCLSLPETFEDIKRFETLIIEYQDLEGKSHSLDADGLLAICIQHENDHLDGITFMDYLSGLKREFYRKKLLKVKKRRGQ